MKRRKKKASYIPWSQRVFHELDQRDAERDEEYRGKGGGGVTINLARIFRWHKKKKK
jgi:hypothetical protein